MLEGIKFLISTILVCLVLGGLGYFAFTSIDSGSEYVSKEKLSALAEENDSLRKEIEKLQEELVKYQPVINTQEETEVATSTPTQTAVKSINPKYTQLVSELEALTKDNIQMKLKSRGTRVGTVQNFLNIYNNTSNKVDNDYGESTKKAVMVFQKAVGLPVTGETGPNTYTKMIEWLKNN